MPSDRIEPPFISGATPRAGTVERAVWDAEHAVWCGADCGPSCRQWHPDLRAIRAAVAAVRDYDRGK